VKIKLAIIFFKYLVKKIILKKKQQEKYISKKRQELPFLRFEEE